MTEQTSKHGGLSGNDAKGYAEAIEKIEQLSRRLVNDIREVFDREGRETKREIASDLHDLRFDSLEFRALLNRVVEGKEGKKQAREIGEMLSDTAGQVSVILMGLTEAHREFLIDRFGAGMWNKIDTEIRDAKLLIRKKLNKLAEGKLNQVAMSDLASEILTLTEKFNENLAKICDTISPPRNKMQ